jgi:Methyltransferase FkbM domain
VTVDAILPANRPVSIVQLDVEGHEQYALTGALQTIRRSRPILILETLPDARWIEQNLAPLGYRQEAKVPDNFILTCN